MFCIYPIKHEVKQRPWAMIFFFSGGGEVGLVVHFYCYPCFTTLPSSSAPTLHLLMLFLSSLPQARSCEASFGMHSLLHCGFKRPGGQGREGVLTASDGGKESER